MSASHHHSSWLRLAKLVKMDGVEFWAHREIDPAPRSVTDTRHVVQRQDRLDLLAFRYYGDWRLEWAIAVANDIRDMTLDLKVGMVLIIPDKSTIDRIRAI